MFDSEKRRADEAAATKDVGALVARLEELDIWDDDRAVETFMESTRETITEYFGQAVMGRVETLLRRGARHTVIDILQTRALMRFRYAIKQRLLFGVALPLLLFALGAASVVGGSYGLSRGRASVGWPATDGLVVSSRIVVTSSSSSGSRGGTAGSSTRAEIHYNYMLDGKEYSSETVSYRNNSGAHETVKRYPEGKSISVYYDPDDPSVAVLERGIDDTSYLPLLGGVPIVLSLWMLYSLYVRGRVI